MSKLVQLLKVHEGLRLKPYTDSQGTQTIGYGHNLNYPITRAAAEEILLGDIAFVVTALQTRLPYLHDLDPIRRTALIDMAFNLGVEGLLSFKKMLKAVEEREWDTVYTEALDSHWARQVGVRARTIATMLATGEWPSVLENT